MQGLRGGMPVAQAAALLRAHADSELPNGFRVSGVQPVVARAGRNMIFRFRLEYGGVKLAQGSDFAAVVGAGGALLASRLRNVPSSVNATLPAVDSSVAAQAAMEHARTALGQSGALTATTPELEIWIDAQRRGWLSWSLTVREETDGTVSASTRYLISAADGPRVLSAENALHYDSTIHLDADVFQLSPNLPTVVVPLTDARVNAGLIVLTDLNGNAVFPAIAPGAQVIATLQGPFASVRRATPPNVFGAITASGGNDTIHIGSGVSSTTAFYSTTFINRWVRGYLSIPSGTFLDGMSVVVDDNIPCNAFSTGDSIHFGAATPSCNNMATPTVVMHEFGHSVHALLTTDFDAAYSEGFGDALAALATGQPCMGPGRIPGSEDCIRDATDVTTWPVPSSDPHEVGKPYAQFAWALATNLGIDTAAGLVMGTAAAAPVDIPDAVRLAFVADDDDGLLGTCSPNQKAIEAAADSRQLPRPQDCRPAGDNAAPTAGDDAIALSEDDEPLDIDILANDSDPDGDHLVVANIQQGLLGTLDCRFTPCTYRPKRDANGSETLTYTVIDTYGGSATAAVHIEIIAVEDTLGISGPFDAQGVEDEAVPVSVFVFDPDGPAFTFQWFAGTAQAPAPCTFADPFAFHTTVTCTRDGLFPIFVIATQGSQQFTGPTASLEILNTHPSVVITSPAAGSSFAGGQTVDVAASFEDGPTPGPHTCDVIWGDGTSTAGVVGTGTCTASHVYAAGSAGARQIVVVVRDPGLAAGTASVAINLTYTDGSECLVRPGQTCFIVGAGVLGSVQPILFQTLSWRNSAGTQGALFLYDTARASVFAFSVPTLSTADKKALFSGTGTMDGVPGFSFEAYAEDRRPSGASAGSPDVLLIAIRNSFGEIVRVYLNQVTAGDITIN